jgi:hypothetical protein
MSNSDDDTTWIKVLETGHIDPNNTEISKKALILRKSMLEKAASVKQFQPSNIGFNRMLAEAKQNNLLFSEKQVSTKSTKWVLNWTVLIASIASAFSFGLLISRVNLLPEIVANRGTQEKYEANFGSSKSISVVDKSPDELSEKIVKIVINSGLEITVSKAGESYVLKFKNTKFNDNQIADLLKTLNVDPDYHGTLIVTVVPVN